MMARDIHVETSKIVSPLSEHSFQNDEACIQSLNSTMAEFFQKLDRPANASIGVLRVGPIVEEIINKELTKVMLNCKKAPVGSLPQLAEHLIQNGKNFYAEQLAIQKIDFKPRPKVEANNIIKIDNLKATLNDLRAQKENQETVNKQLESIRKDYQEQIRQLKRAKESMIQQAEHERDSGRQYRERLRIARVELADAPKKYATLKARHDEILRGFCNCVQCKSNQQPSLTSLYAGRSVSEADNMLATTEPPN
ncbi:uncharacterized protein LOC130703869 [Daphnia carinata]|uniref:uncharacterized protein LOC130703869 n=1 Tax=Daphnia carinata TaxID=120202 RepID=UPI0025796B11|nr:uncharacterized protein LOC130703869 [Daphnia carinata]